MSDTDNSVGLVKSSYDDVNTALEKLLGNVSSNGSTVTMDEVNSAIAIEAQRAEKAEASLLPLSGGALTGNVTGSLGGPVPQVLGLSGRVVIQSFVAGGSGGYGTIYFPTPFAAGTTPIVTLTPNYEPATQYQTNGVTRVVGLTNTNVWSSGPNITSTSATLRVDAMATWSGGSVSVTGTGYAWNLQVIAIGVM